MADKKLSRVALNQRYKSFHKFTCALSLVCFAVVVAAGLKAEVRTFTVVWRSLIVILSIAFISRMLLKVWTSFEEMNHG